jgi:hypothetical protein
MDIAFTQAVEILANIGVLGGIVFLALQIRQNNEELRAQSRFNYFQTRIGLSKELATNFDLGRIAISKASGDELTPQESYHSFLWAATVLAGWRYEFGEYKKGNLALEELDLATKRRAYGFPGWSFREVFAAVSESEFKQFVQDQIVAPYEKDPSAYGIEIL